MPRIADQFRSPVALLLFFGTTVVGLALDLWSKAASAAHFAESPPPMEVIPRWLNITYTQNFGAVFGLGQGQRLLFIIVSIGAIGFLTYLFALSQGRRFYQFMLGLLLAGVLGNMYDRIIFGYVRDMIHALPGFYWPQSIGKLLPAAWAEGGLFPWVFNIADSMLCVGVFLMIVYSALYRPKELSDPSQRTGKPETQRESAVES